MCTNMCTNGGSLKSLSPGESLLSVRQTHEERRGRDSNPRYPEGLAVFKSGAFSRSATSPRKACAKPVRMVVLASVPVVQNQCRPASDVWPGPPPPGMWRQPTTRLTNRPGTATTFRIFLSPTASATFSSARAAASRPAPRQRGTVSFAADLAVDLDGHLDLCPAR